MSFVTTGLRDNIESANELLQAGVLFNDDMANYSLQSGISYIEELQYLTVAPDLSQTVCGTAEGTTTISKKDITVAQYVYKDKFCYTDLDTKSIADTDVMGTIAKGMQTTIATKINHDLWIGSGADYIDGWLTQVAAAGDYIDATNSAYSSADISNIDDIVIELIANVSAEMYARGVLTIYMDLATFNLYKQNRLAANYFRDANTEFGPLEMWAFGYEGQVKVAAKVGIGSNKNLMLTWEKNLVIGVDEISKESTADFIDEPVTKLVHFRSDFKLGASIYYTNEVVYMELA